MDFKFTQEQEVMREEVRDFFKEEERNAPQEWFGKHEEELETDTKWAYHKSVEGKLAQKGWLSLPWPREYGGQELGVVEQAIFSEVRSYHRVPGVSTGTQIVAPALLEFGSEEMKKEWLPRMARGEITWCQGWSEPNAGSDLASLTTRAAEDGDDYIINGQKIWTTWAHRADYIFLLARTEPDAPKHRGLTYFLSKMDRPGITVHPLYFMNQARVYNEVFFDNLRIPKRNIVGQVNQGWYVTMAGINFERSGTGGAASLQRDLEDLVQFYRETGHHGQAIARNTVVRWKLADLAIDIAAARQWAYYVAWLQSKNPSVATEPSASKYFITELGLRLANTGLEVMGLYGTLKQGSRWAFLKGKFEHLCQLYLGGTIGGGTTEIQKNLIAWMGLQLPRTR